MGYDGIIRVLALCGWQGDGQYKRMPCLTGPLPTVPPTCHQLQAPQFTCISSCFHHRHCESLGKQLLPMYLIYSSTAVVKHSNRGILWEKGFILAHSLRSKPSSWWGNQGCSTLKQTVTLNPQLEHRQLVNVHYCSASDLHWHGPGSQPGSGVIRCEQSSHLN